MLRKFHAKIAVIPTFLLVLVSSCACGGNQADRFQQGGVG